jgi:hypothetical protein
MREKLFRKGVFIIYNQTGVMQCLGQLEFIIQRTVMGSRDANPPASDSKTCGNSVAESL